MDPRENLSNCIATILRKKEGRLKSSSRLCGNPNFNLDPETRSHSPRNLLTDLCLAKSAQRAFVLSSVRLQLQLKKVAANFEETQSPFISTSFRLLTCQCEAGCAVTLVTVCSAFIRWSRAR